MFWTHCRHSVVQSVCENWPDSEFCRDSASTDSINCLSISLSDLSGFSSPCSFATWTDLSWPGVSWVCSYAAG